MAADLPAAERPTFEVMDTRSATFRNYLRVRRHRFDDFYIQPALGADLCKVQVPVRRKV
jgi:peptidylprolyl isomerase